MCACVRKMPSGRRPAGERMDLGRKIRRRIEDVGAARSSDRRARGSRRLSARRFRRESTRRAPPGSSDAGCRRPARCRGRRARQSSPGCARIPGAATTPTVITIASDANGIGRAGKTRYQARSESASQSIQFSSAPCLLRHDLIAIARRAMSATRVVPDFSPAALAEVQAVDAHQPDANPAVRDLTDLLWASIDNQSSRDLDQPR